MTCRIIYEVITLLCYSVCGASIQGPGNVYFGNQIAWNSAWKVCHDNQTRLPNVKVSESGLELADIIHWKSNECFWIGATYERITNYTYGTFPTVCCGTVTKKNNDYVRSCDNCEGTVQFVCESGPNTVSEDKLRNISLPWINASKECSDRGLRLPSVNNTVFLGRVQASVWWINEARILNLSPMAAKNGDIPICFCEAASMNFQCSYNVKTYCMPDTRSNISTTVTRKLSMLSTDTYSTIPITTVTTINSRSDFVVTSSVKPSSMRSLDDFSTDMYAAVTSINGESLNEKSNAMEKTNTRFQSVTRSTTVNTGATGNSTLVGSLIGTAVAVIVILTIVVIVIVRRKRTKKRATDDIHYETQMIARSNKKVQPQANSLYGIVFDDTLDMDSTSTALPRIRAISQEPELHTQPKNIKQINNKDDHKCVNNKEPPFYGMVQKGQRKTDTAEVIEEGYINNKEYDKTEFEKRYVSESFRDMYDEATMHRLEPYKELDANVHNMTGFCCTTFDKNECNGYDKENCSQIENLYDNITQ